MNKKLGMTMVLLAAFVLLAVAACGSSATAPVPTQPPPTETPVTVAPTEEPATVEAPAPIEDATVVAPVVVGGDYIVKITSGLPNGCAKFNGYEVGRDGNRFRVDVTNLVPDPSEPIACIEIYGLHEGEVALGSGLQAGTAYTVSVNNDFLISFTAQDRDGTAMVEKESPIVDIDVAQADGGYLLTVISTLPKGSTCSKFSGYKINQRFAERIEVTVTHMEVTERYVGICTSDLPSVITEIPLGLDFDEGRTYTVVVNGTEATFPEDEPATVVVPAPIEDATVVAPENPGGEYTLEITSGLPSGCARFNGYDVNRSGNDYSVKVTNLMPAPDEPIACTAIYGYHDGHFSLEGVLNPGETYTVTINGKLTNSFTVAEAGAPAMVEKESPIEQIEVVEVEGEYLLTVISRLPLGSSCSQFNGYKINWRFAERIEVTVTHMEVAADNVPCTRDLPVVVTEIPLGSDFDSGRTYTVSVNGEETAFTAK